MSKKQPKPEDVIDATMQDLPEDVQASLQEVAKHAKVIAM